MVPSKYIASLIVVLGLVLMWTHFCSHVGFSLYQARMNQDNLLIPGCGRRVSSGNLQMGKALKLSFIFVISISYAVVVSGSFYKLLTHNKSTYKVINGHASIHFFQWQGRTVMSLNDYIRDRLNNNLGMHELMKYEWARYESFKLYPLTAPLSPLKLARAGFYFTGENQTVKCFCCGELFDANDYGELNEAHQRNSRNCSFVRGEASANIPIKHSGRSDNVNLGSREDQGVTQCRNPNYELRLVSYRSYRRWRHRDTNIPIKHFGRSDNVNVTQCRYPNYVTEESRRQTFRSWPHRNEEQIQEMVNAGLFYTGTEDLVRCYHCGVGLENWLDTNYPWVQHTYYSPDCQHVRQQRPAWIRSLLDNPDLRSNSDHRQRRRTRISCEMRTKLAQRLLQMGYTEGRIIDAFNYFRRSGRKVLSIHDVLDHIKTTEPNNYTMLCTNMTAANNSVDQIEASQTESAQKSKKETDADLCKVCVDKEVRIVFLPCGHRVTCEDCAPKFRKCIVCRAVIKGTVRAHVS